MLSVIHNVCDRHKFVGNEYDKLGDHDTYTEEEVTSRGWPKIGPPPQEALKKFLLQPQVVKNMKK